MYQDLGSLNSNAKSKSEPFEVMQGINIFKRKKFFFY